MSKRDISLEKSVNEYLKTVSKKSYVAKTTYRDAKSSLLGDKNDRRSKEGIESGGSIRYFIDMDGVEIASEITRDHLQAYNDDLWQYSEKQTTRNRKLSQLRSYLHWAIRRKHTTSITKEDLNVLKQKEYFPPKAEQPAAGILKRLKTDITIFAEGDATDSDKFLQLRNYLMFYFCVFVNGVRPVVEICSLNLRDVDENNLEITIRRKRSLEKAPRRQTIAFRKDFAEYISRYKIMRERHISSNNVFCDLQEGTEAFFIRLNPAQSGRKRDISWRLDCAGASLAFRDICSRLEIKMKPYLLRHASITNQIENARILGVDCVEIAHRNDHLLDTCLSYYNDILRYGVELTTRDPEELTDFLERFAHYHLANFLRSPENLRDYAAYMQVMGMLGKVRFRETVKAYRENKIPEIDSRESKDSVHEFLKQRLSADLTSWKGGIGTAIRRNMFPAPNHDRS